VSPEVGRSLRTAGEVPLNKAVESKVPGAGEIGSLVCFALCGFILRGLGYATIHRVVSQMECGETG